MRRPHARTRVNTKSSKSNMDPQIKLQIRPGGRSGFPFYRNNTNNPKHAKSNPLLMAAYVFSLLLLVSCCYLLFFNKNNQTSVLKYAVVIDGGSTGTRIHVFVYRVEGGKPVIEFGENGYASMRVNPGLSAFAENPDGIRGSLEELVEFGREKVPEEVLRETEIRLMATAGMRLLDIRVQEDIMVACRRVLRSSGFKFRDEWASVISGSDEGMYAWVVANHALGSLGGDPVDTTGIIELGGASAQVTFASSEPMPPEFSRTIKFGNLTYNLYSHSFLHFGQNVAFDSLRESLISADIPSAAVSLQKKVLTDPCIPKGYLDPKSLSLSPDSLTEKNKYITNVQAAGNFSACRSTALTLLQTGIEKCSYQRCYIGSTFTPKLHGKFLATENFFYTSKFFGLGQKAFLSDILMAGEQFCREDWSKLKTKHSSLEEEDLLRYCFSSAYIVALLHDSFGIALDDERIQFANQVGDIPLDWALGAFILQSASAMNTRNCDWLSSIVSDESRAVVYLIGISVILMVIVWSVSKLRKPPLKTVYDLEKGRYIVTRIR